MNSNIFSMYGMTSMLLNNDLLEVGVTIRMKSAAYGTPHSRYTNISDRFNGKAHRITELVFIK